MTRASEIRAIRPDLIFWQVFEPAVKTDLTCCARLTPHGWVLIDPVGLTDEAESKLLAVSPLRGVILTSENHARAAIDFQTRYSIPIFAHAEAIANLDCPVDQIVGDGERILEAFDVVTLPGAAAGEIALHGHDVVHLGDALIHLPGYGFTTLPDKYCSDPGELRRSLEKLLRLSFEILTFAHGLPLLSAARQRLAQLLS